jgi:predicted ATP-dependent serine protease
VEELIEYADQYVEKPPKGTKAQDWLPRRETWLFIDSLFGMFVPRPEGQRGRDKGQQLMQEAVFKRLIEWAKENFVICFVLGHVNKAGKAAGKNSLIHLGDGHLHLGRKFDKETKESFLAAEMLKNRGGPTAIEYRYEATKSGITWQDEARGSTSCDIGGDDDE